MISPKERVIIEPPVSPERYNDIVENLKRNESAQNNARRIIGTTACWLETPESELSKAKVYIRPIGDGSPYQWETSPQEVS